LSTSHKEPLMTVKRYCFYT